MQITPNEIDTIEDAGVLDGKPVKMLKTKGGFWIAVGIPKGKIKEEALAAGSHPAIVKFNLEKMHPSFQPMMMKSETLTGEAIVEKHSHFLTESLRKSGHDVYSVQNGPDVDFYITKQNVKISSVSGSIQDNTLVIPKIEISKEFTRALAAATSEKAISCGVKKIKVGS
jgi:hypothetical protein